MNNTIIMKSLDRLYFEKQLWSEGFQRVMGLDEVGRGCLAGPVVVAGVIFKPNIKIAGITDSKKLSEKKRMDLSDQIKSKAEFWIIKEGTISLINELNILWASLQTMKKCAEHRGANAEYLLVDGNRYIDSLIPYTCLVKGDDRSLSIGAASILAKVYRDNLMRKLHNEYPEFGWDKNVGYPTPKHKDALSIYGYTIYHRRSFKLGTNLVYKN